MTTDLILLIFFIVLLCYYLFFLSGIYRGLNNLKKQDEEKIPDEKISVIIPFRNEEENVLSCLNSIENLDYPHEKLEVIFVDDFSGDKSFHLLESNNKSAHIKIISVPEDFSPNAHKKRAVRYGIEKSTGEIIVTTDADCIHNSAWLKSLLKYFNSSTGFVSGPVEFDDKGTLFGKIQRLEFAGLILAGAGLIGINRPTICNAANAAYRKKAFNEVRGFEDNYHLSSGDDELLMQKIHKHVKYKVVFASEPGAIVKTSVNKNLKEFYNQRKRWASKGLFYADKLLSLKLFLIFLFYLSLPVQFLLAGFYSPLFIISLLISLAGKFYYEYRIIKKGTEAIFSKKILQPFLLAEFIQIPYIIIASIGGVIGGYYWKGRKVKR